jgi:AcrR family transcriptional regulator
MRKTDQKLIDIRIQGIQDAALRCFAKMGFSAASMRHIATEAGVSLGLLYRYFDDKAAIVAAAIKADSGEFRLRLEELSAREPTDETLLEFLEEEVVLRSGASVFALTAEIVAEAARDPTIASLVRQNIETAEADLAEVLLMYEVSRESTAPRQSAKSRAIHILGLVDLLATRVFFKLEVNVREGLRSALEGPGL